MKRLIVDIQTHEIIGVGNFIPSGSIEVLAPDNFEFITTQWIYDTNIHRIPGTILTEEQISKLPIIVEDQISRLQKIQDETNILVGLNVISMTDAQRWKLLAIVLYKLGVINSNGVVQPFNEWLDIS